MNAKTLITGVLVALTLSFAANADGGKGVTKKAEIEAPAVTEATAVLSLIADGKATYRYVDLDGTTWTVKVTAKKAKKSKGEKAPVAAADDTDGTGPNAY